MPRAAFLLMLILAVAGRSALADGFTLDTRRSGEAIEIAAVAEIRADAGRAWAVLTDYEAYPGFVPDLSVSRIVQREGAALVLEQQGALRLWWWRVPIVVRLAVVEEAPHTVRSRLLEGSLRDFEGRYELQPVRGGVRLVYTGRVVPDPAQRSLLDQLAVRASVSRQFGALVEEIRVRGGEAAGGVTSGPAPDGG